MTFTSTLGLEFALFFENAFHPTYYEKVALTGK